MEGLFDRLKQVRDVDKKHVQRRAYIDLLKFMKDQGLKANFQDKIQPLIVESKLVNVDDKHLQTRLEKYYYKAHELLIITEASSQVDENSDLKNADIIRIQGFTQSLMHQILTMNKHLRDLQLQTDNLSESVRKLPCFNRGAGEAGVEDQDGNLAKGQEVIITHSNMKWFETQRDLLLTQVSLYGEKVGLIALLEGRRISFGASKLSKTKETTGLSSESLEQLHQDVEAVIEASSNMADLHPDSRRLRGAAQEFTRKANCIKQALVDRHAELYGPSGTHSSAETTSVLSSRSKLLQKYTQLLYQSVHEHVLATWETQVEDAALKEQVRKESFDRSTVQTTSADGTVKLKTSSSQIERQDHTLAEQETFTHGLCDACRSKDLLRKITKLAHSIFALEDLDPSQPLTSGDLACLSGCQAVL